MLRQNKLKVKFSKCHFWQKQVKFLGHVVSEASISVDPSEVDAIQNWKRPETVTDIRSFLGLAANYRRFIKDFSKMALPLPNLTSKGVKFVWADGCEAAF